MSAAAVTNALPNTKPKELKMKKTALLLTAIAGLSLSAADSNPKDEITAAAKKLGESDNYSWRTTVVVPEDAPFKPGPTEGN